MARAPAGPTGNSPVAGVLGQMSGSLGIRRASSDRPVRRCTGVSWKAALIAGPATKSLPGCAAARARMWNIIE